MSNKIEDMNARELLEKFGEMWQTIDGSTDDVDVIEKEITKLLDEYETALNNFYKRKYLEMIPSTDEIENTINYKINTSKLGEGIRNAADAVLADIRKAMEEGR